MNKRLISSQCLLLLLTFFLVGMVVAEQETCAELFASERYSEANSTCQQELSKNHAEAIYYLGRMQWKGLAVPRDEDAALKKLLLAAEQGYNRAHFQLAMLYGFAEVMERDHALAIKHLQKVDDAEDRPQALLALGVVYWEGEHVEQDLLKAEHYFKQSAEAGSADAQVFLANFYLKQKKDFRAAYPWAKKAAEADVSGAKYLLGRIYQYYLQDPKQAVYWYDLAAQEGDYIAKVTFGYEYVNGGLFDKDVNEGYAWLALAEDERDLAFNVREGQVEFANKWIQTVLASPDFDRDKALKRKLALAEKYSIKARSNKK